MIKAVTLKPAKLRSVSGAVFEIYASECGKCVLAITTDHSGERHGLQRNRKKRWERLWFAPRSVQHYHIGDYSTQRLAPTTAEAARQRDLADTIRTCPTRWETAVRRAQLRTARVVLAEKRHSFRQAEAVHKYTAQEYDKAARDCYNTARVIDELTKALRRSPSGDL